MQTGKKIILLIFLCTWLSYLNKPVWAEDLLQKPNSNASYSLSNSQSFIVGVTNWLGLNLAGIIAPRGQKVEIPDFLQFGQWLSQASAYFQPLAIRGKIKDFSTPQTSSSKYKVCLRQTAGGKVKTSQGETSGREVTREINWINPLTQGSEYLNATMGNKTLTDFDFDRKNVLVLQADECGENDLGIDLSSQTVALAQSASLGGGATLGTYLSEILAWISGGKLGQETTATITRSTVLSRAEDFGCNAAGCTEEEVKNAPEDKNKQMDLVRQGGFTQTILPLPAQQLDQDYGQTPITIETNAGVVEGKDPYSLTGRVKTFLDRSACLLAPLAKHNQLTGIDCAPINVPQTTSCGTGKLPELTSSCSLYNTDNIRNLVDDKESVPEGIPATMKAIIEKAGEIYKVSPANILAILYHEGAFSGGRFVGSNAWTEANVKKWSLCGGKMPSCDENASDSQSPYGFFPRYFKDTFLKDAVLAIDPSRKGNTSVCNFMDVTFAAAQVLFTNAADNYKNRKDITEPMCFGRPMSVRTVPSSCQSPPWNADLAFKSHVLYGGYCPEPAIVQIRKNKGLWQPYEVPQPKLANWVVNWYNAFTRR